MQESGAPLYLRYRRAARHWSRPQGASLSPRTNQKRTPSRTSTPRSRPKTGAPPCCRRNRPQGRSPHTPSEPRPPRKSDTPLSTPFLSSFCCILLVTSDTSRLFMTGQHEYRTDTIPVSQRMEHPSSSSTQTVNTRTSGNPRKKVCPVSTSCQSLSQHPFGFIQFPKGRFATANLFFAKTQNIRMPCGDGTSSLGHPRCAGIALPSADAVSTHSRMICSALASAS